MIVFGWVCFVVAVAELKIKIQKEKEFMKTRKQPRLSTMRIQHLHSRIAKIMEEEE